MSCKDCIYYRETDKKRTYCVFNGWTDAEDSCRLIRVED